MLSLSCACPFDRQIKNCVLSEFSVSHRFKAIHLSDWTVLQRENFRICYNKHRLECFAFRCTASLVRSHHSNPTVPAVVCKELKALYNVSQTIKPVPFNLAFGRGHCAKRIKTTSDPRRIAMSFIAGLF